MQMMVLSRLTNYRHFSPLVVHRIKIIFNNLFWFLVIKVCSEQYQVLCRIISNKQLVLGCISKRSFKVSKKIVIKMPIRELSEQLKEVCELELNEVAKQLPDDLKYLKKWLSQQPHLKARTDDQWLLAFLRGCKFRLEKVKEKFDTFYTIRTLVPEFFTNRDPFQPEIQGMLKLGVILPLPQPLSPKGERIIFLRFGGYDPKKIPYVTLVKTFFMIQDILLNEDDNIIIAGQQIIGDVEEVGLELIKHAHPNIVQKMLVCVQQCYPARLKGLHYFNVPPVFDLFMKLLLPFLNSKTKQRLTAHTTAKHHEFNDIIPQEVLPFEYGGKNENLENLTATWKKKVESYQKWFESDNEYRSNEKKRFGNPKTAEAIFGIEGSFRKLNID